jgi:hypothetical protein
MQSENKTVHHAVMLMDLYASRMREEYDSVLISIVCLMISSKYH